MLPAKLILRLPATPTSTSQKMPMVASFRTMVTLPAALQARTTDTIKVSIPILSLSWHYSAHGTSSLDWGPGRECLSSFSPPPSAETYYQNPTAIHGVAYHWSAADARRFDGLPVVGIASALYQRAPTTTENQAVNAPSQQFLSSHPVAAHVQQSLTSYAHPSAYAGEPSINGSPALNSGSIGHGMGGSVMYPPVSSPGIMYDGGITAERSFRMRMFGGVPRPDQASNEDALSERLPSADIAQSASPLGLDATPGRRRRGRDELAISRRRKAPGQFACPHCTTATFTTKAAREKHIESLHLNKVYRCGIDGCPKEYSHQASLDRHRRDTHDISKKRYGGAVD
ncbi:hypothetical protein BDZ89DRAFT_355684 [Hymenopellis radicata]|nr:hypothetical protein BDZ89DRAFT_355684 [Hymenopellis radicata]